MSRDLMYKDDVQRLVTGAYEALGDPGGPALRFYSDEQAAQVPEDVRNWALGVGNPVPWAELRQGDVVADLGCGAGIDTQLAAERVGPAGRVLGFDILAPMLRRASAGARGRDNVGFVQAEIESIPLAASSVDAVVSNGTINLSARKSRVLAEAHRVLRPGGTFCAADLTIREEDLPSEVLSHPSAWAG